MTNELIYFLNGETAIQVKTADDMKKFVNWLKYYHCEDYLVSNLKYQDEYFKISFWKDIVKQDWVKGWIHPSRIKVIFVAHSVDGIRTYLFEDDMKKWEGDITILEANELGNEVER